MVNFSLLPPEVNSALIYSAPGAEKLGALASEWDCFAMGLQSTAASFDPVIAQLIANWPGPSAIRLAGAAALYAFRVSGMATRAAHVAAKVKAAEANFKTISAMAVPPRVLAANRAWLTTLATTNLVGQNAQAIAAAETHYHQMWAQDAVAVNGYIIAFHHEFQTRLSARPRAARLASDPTPSTIAGAHCARSAEVFSNPKTEKRWALSSLMAPGWFAENLGQTTSWGTTTPGPQSARTIDSASVSERLAMYPVGMLAQSAQICQAGPELTAKSNALLNGFGELVDCSSELVAERLTDHAREWMSNVSARIAEAVSLGVLSIPPAWLVAAPEVGRAAPESLRAGTYEPSAASSMGRKTGQER